jgi:hypothetical protein
VRPNIVGGTCGVILLIGLGEPRVAEPQSSRDCGAEICLESGASNWRYEASQYCEAEVCLRDSLASLIALDWDRMTAGQFTLFSSPANPYIGLTNAEYEVLRAARNSDLSGRIELLAKVRSACRPAELSLRLEVPGYDIVEVTFGMPLAGEGEREGFQVTQIRRTYRGLPGGSVGWWVRWISYRFPGIVLLQGEPREYASYEIGLYMGGLVLFDKEFRPGAPEEYSAQPLCMAR